MKENLVRKWERRNQIITYGIILRTKPEGGIHYFYSHSRDQNSFKWTFLMQGRWKIQPNSVPRKKRKFLVYIQPPCATNQAGKQFSTKTECAHIYSITQQFYSQMEMPVHVYTTRHYKKLTEVLFIIVKTKTRIKQFITYS